MSAREAVIQRTNPVTRLLLAVILTIPVIITLDWLSAAVIVACCLLLSPLLGFGPKDVLKRMVPLFLVAPVAALSMALYGKPGGEIHFKWLFIIISDQSLQLAVAVFVRVFALGLPSILLLTTVDPTDMADGLAQVLKLPARFVLGTLAGVRMIGLFLDDWRTLEHARRARGLGDSGRLKRFATMAFTLMVLALRRAARLATAMEARGFGGRARIWARPSRMGWADAAAVLLAVAIVALSLWMAWRFGTLLVMGKGSVE